MKGNIKKLAVFVIITAIAMFMSVAMASADDHHDHHWKNTIRGEYAVTQMLSAIFSIGGFNLPDLTPKCFTPPAGSPVCLSSVMLVQREGVFTFEKDGTGSATLNGSSITVSPPSGSTFTASFKFDYTMNDDGTITITVVPGTFFTNYTSGPNKGATVQAEGVILTGPISPDGKNINLVGANMTTLIAPGLPPVENNLFGQSSTFLIWQHSEKE